MKNSLAATLQDRYLSSIAKQEGYRRQHGLENIRRTVLFAKVVTVLVASLIGVMVGRYQGGDLATFLVTESYSLLFFGYLFCSLLLILCTYLPIRLEIPTLLYRIALLVLASPNAMKMTFRSKTC